MLLYCSISKHKTVVGADDKNKHFKTKKKKCKSFTKQKVQIFMEIIFFKKCFTIIDWYYYLFIKNETSNKHFFSSNLLSHPITDMRESRVLLYTFKTKETSNYKFTRLAKWIMIPLPKPLNNNDYFPFKRLNCK